MVNVIRYFELVNGKSLGVVNERLSNSSVTSLWFTGQLSGGARPYNEPGATIYHHK